MVSINIVFQLYWIMYSLSWHKPPLISSFGSRMVLIDWISIVLTCVRNLEWVQLPYLRYRKFVAMQTIPIRILVRGGSYQILFHFVYIDVGLFCFLEIWYVAELIAPIRLLTIIAPSSFDIQTGARTYQDLLLYSNSGPLPWSSNILSFWHKPFGFRTSAYWVEV